jgi:hypothetical protein
MKKYVDIAKTALAAALGLLLFAACINPVTPRLEQTGDLAEGKGAVRIGTGAGAARTAVPEAVFHHFEYLFSKGGDTPAPKTPDGPEAVFELDIGSWTVTVKAFAGAGEETLAAQGSEDFAVAGGEETEVTVRLSPVTGEGTGTLNYTLTYPAAATVNAFTLTLLAGDADTDLASGAVPGGTDPETLTGTAASVTSGFYLARASLVKGGVPVEKSEVVHIYKDMTTELALEFVDDDFKAVVVVSSADSGPGTLRAALTAVSTSGGAVVIDLPAGDRVITLLSVLPQITKAVVIAGGGATLTQSGITPGETSQLLRITGVGAEVSISRLHFKGARATRYGGAIYNYQGKLTLESCIFSDNMVSGGASTDVSGGAIYAGGSSVTVSGCTFYKNSTTSTGGAIYIPSSSVTIKLTGNIFWGNTRLPGTSDSVSGGSATTGGFNVGWLNSGTDKTAYFLPVSSVSFRPINGGEAVSVITARPEGYPVTDFYGDPVPAENAASGAVQTEN